ncbi:MAG TPA: hypothetical protein VMR52_11085 [Dehalococcoidia bacterium]|nr:hypothetical protein [Dehalococcoidia bacterium]
MKTVLKTATLVALVAAAGLWSSDADADHPVENLPECGQLLPGSDTIAEWDNNGSGLVCENTTVRLEIETDALAHFRKLSWAVPAGCDPTGMCDDSQIVINEPDKEVWAKCSSPGAVADAFNFQAWGDSDDQADKGGYYAVGVTLLTGSCDTTTAITLAQEVLGKLPLSKSGQDPGGPTTPNPGGQEEEPPPGDEPQPDPASTDYSPPPVYPPVGGDGEVTLTIEHPEASDTESAHLRREGEDDIFGDFVAVGDDGLLRGTFDLSGAADGAWDVVLNGEDGHEIVVGEGFQKDSSLNKKRLRVDVYGATALRPERDRWYAIEYRNQSWVDAKMVPLSIALPTAVNPELQQAGWATSLHDSQGFSSYRGDLDPTLSFLEPPDDEAAATSVRREIDWDSVPLGYEQGAETVFPIVVPIIPAWSRGTIYVKANAAFEGEFKIRAWIGDCQMESPLAEAYIDCMVGAASFAYQAATTLIPGGSCVQAGKALMANQAGTWVEIVRTGINDGDPIDYVVPATWWVGDLTLAVAECMASFNPAFQVGRAVKLLYEGTKLLSSYGSFLGGCGGLREDDALSLSELLVLVGFSLDPNEKLGPRSAHGDRYLGDRQNIPYSILFENLETATAAAQEILITDELDEDTMDLATFELGPILFGHYSVAPPPGRQFFEREIDLRPEENLIIHVEAGLDGHTAYWRLTSLDPDTRELPDGLLDGVLQPNVNPPEGDGMVMFSVDHRSDLANGSEIANNASIVFDTNEPIITNEWVNLVGEPPGGGVSALMIAAVSVGAIAVGTGTGLFVIIPRIRSRNRSQK